MKINHATMLHFFPKGPPFRLMKDRALCGVLKVSNDKPDPKAKKCPICFALMELSKNEKVFYRIR
jgi:hypothetical protein